MGKVVVVKYYVLFSFLPISYEVTCFRSSCFLQILQEINLICNGFQVINKKTHAYNFYNLHYFID